MTPTPSTLAHARQSKRTTALLEQLNARHFEPYRELRGHDFFPPRRELDQVPNMVTAARRRPARRMLYLHYVSGRCHYYVAGYEPSTGFAYGYTVNPAIDLHDWGWFDLNILCTLRYGSTLHGLTRRDLTWQPRRARDVIAPDLLAG